jgi:hypothetical protein
VFAPDTFPARFRGVAVQTAPVVDSQRLAELSVRVARRSQALAIQRETIYA